MHTRILVGAAAWLLGAATATGGSLLAVSLLGQGITEPGGPLLAPQAVNRALIAEPTETEAPSGFEASPALSPSAAPSGAVFPTGGPAPSAAPAASTPAASAPAPAVLTSAGGEVMASCLPAGVYLDSWSPLSGYEVGDVRRGPAPAARVTFESASGSVTMTVSCSSGLPSAATYSRSGGHGDD